MFENMSRKISKLKYYKTPLLMIFSFLFGCMLTINITPINKTCRIEESDPEYNIMKNSKLKNPELIILVLSAPKNLHKRNIIRQTWLNLIDRRPDKLAGFKVAHYFVIGSLGLSVDDIFHLSTEQSQFSDILILPMYDSYQNLTEKVLKSFEWLHEQYDYGLGYKFVLKCDDDSFIRLDKLAEEIVNIESRYLKTSLNNLKTLEQDTSSPFIRLNTQINNNSKPTELGLYWGYFNGNAKVKTAGKWKEANWIACERYVPYALGGAYVLSQNLVRFLGKNIKNLRFFNSEDVSVGLWLSPLNHILRIHDARFDTEWTSRGCQNFYLATHNISVEDMEKMYKNILQTNDLCQDQSVKRRYYLYNWTIPSSQCCSFKQNIQN